MFRIVSLSIVLTLIIILGITFFRVVAPYILPLFLAGVASILSQPLFQYFVRRTNGRVRVAAGLATATLVLALLLPLSVGTALASIQLYTFAGDVATSTFWDESFDRTSATGSRTESIAERIAEFLNDARGVYAPLELSPDIAPPPAAEPRAPEPGVAAPPAAELPAPEPAASDPTSDAPSPAADLVEPNGPPLAADPETSAAEQPPTTLPSLPFSADANVAVAVTPEEREAVDDISTALRTGQPVTAEHLTSLVKAKINAVLVMIGDRSLGLFTGVLFSLVSAAMALFIFTVALYYFFADGTALIAASETLIPVHVDYQRELLQQFSKAVRAVVSATFLASLGQAAATTLALAVCGFGHLLTLFVLCFLSALIPMLGTWLVWGPCAALLAWSGHWVGATLLSLYGIAVVGLLDNVIRTYVLNSDTKLHPLLALISVLGGLQVMGLWGVFVGPIVASCLHALVKIFNHELTVLSRSRFGDQAKAVAGALLSGTGGTSGEVPAAPADPNPDVDETAVIPTPQTTPAAPVRLSGQPPTPFKRNKKDRQRR